MHGRSFHRPSFHVHSFHGPSFHLCREHCCSSGVLSGQVPSIVPLYRVTLSGVNLVLITSILTPTTHNNIANTTTLQPQHIDTTTSQHILAGDCGGTNSRLQLVAFDPSTNSSDILKSHTYLNEEYKSFNEILSDFLYVKTPGEPQLQQQSKHVGVLLLSPIKRLPTYLDCV